jgi:hypothetical protein
LGSTLTQCWQQTQVHVHNIAMGYFLLSQHQAHWGSIAGYLLRTFSQDIASFDGERLDEL